VHHEFFRKFEEEFLRLLDSAAYLVEVLHRFFLLVLASEIGTKKRLCPFDCVTHEKIDRFGLREIILMGTIRIDFFLTVSSNS